jgi:hypothetical protein
MEELIVEGLTPTDFNILKEILKTHRVSLSDTVTFNNIIDLYNKINEIVDCLKE